MENNSYNETDLKEIKANVDSLKKHFDILSKAQKDTDVFRISQNEKLDKIVNALTDTEYNGNKGYITRMTKLEEKVAQHENYWRLLGIILSSGIIISLVVKLIIKD